MATLTQQELPASDLISTLLTRVFSNETHLEAYNYELTSMFQPELVFDGNKDINYTELFAEVLAKDIGDNVDISMFNGKLNKAVRETITADVQANFIGAFIEKTYHDFLTNPSTDNLKEFFSQIEQLVKETRKKYEELLWTELDKTARIKTANVDSLKTAKDIYQTLSTYGTTSKKHFGIGSDKTKDGEIKIGANAISPSLEFDSSEFVIITTPAYDANIEFEGNRTLFNWKGKKLPIHAHKQLDLTIYEGIEKLTLTNITAKTDAIVLHKDAFEMIMKWKNTETERPRNGKVVVRSYAKVKVYKRLDKPVMIYNRA